MTNLCSEGVLFEASGLQDFERCNGFVNISRQGVSVELGNLTVHPLLDSTEILRSQGPHPVERVKSLFDGVHSAEISLLISKQEFAMVALLGLLNSV